MDRWARRLRIGILPMLSLVEGAFVFVEDEEFVEIGFVLVEEEECVGGGLVPVLSYLRLPPASLVEEGEEWVEGGGFVPVLSYLQ